jgi:hypothetical protein
MNGTSNWTRVARRVVTHPATLETIMKTAQSMARRGSNPPVEDWVEQALEMIGLQRKRGTASHIGSALPWLTAGAALGAGAILASPVGRPMVEEALKQVASWASDGWDNSVDMAESFRDQAISRSDEALAQVGLQRSPSTGQRMARAGVWIGVGVAAGVAATMIARSKSAQPKPAHAPHKAEPEATARHEAEHEMVARHTGDAHPPALANGQARGPVPVDHLDHPA